MADLHAHIVSIAKRMFVATADQNYILARTAYFDGDNLDFYWLSLHALEKYFKAILLMNGKSAKGYSHNLLKLYNAVIELDSRLPIGPLINPDVQDLFWHPHSVPDYLKRLNEFGSAENRYNLYGYTLFTEDLFKIDQLMWSVRRCCQPFHSEHINLAGGPPIKIDNVEQLIRNKSLWKLYGHLPLERLLDDKGTNSRRVMFLALNVPFDPTTSHSLAGWQTSSENPPLADYADLIRDPNTARVVREESIDVLKWVLANIQLSKADAAEIAALT